MVDSHVLVRKMLTATRASSFLLAVANVFYVFRLFAFVVSGNVRSVNHIAEHLSITNLDFTGKATFYKVVCFRSDINTNPLPSFYLCGHTSGSTSAEWIHHKVIVIAGCTDDSLE